MDQLEFDQQFVSRQQMCDQAQRLCCAMQGLEQHATTTKGNAAAMAASRARQTEGQRAAVAKQNAIAMAASRAKKIEEQRIAATKQNIVVVDASQVRQTEDQRVVAAKKKYVPRQNAAAMAASRARQTEEQRAAAAKRNAAAMAASRARQTEEQRIAAAKRNAAAVAASRARQTEEQRAATARRNALAMAARRARQTEEQRAATTKQNTVAKRMARQAIFLDVEQQPSVAEGDVQCPRLTYGPTTGRQAIERMDMQCQNCGACHLVGESVDGRVCNPSFNVSCQNSIVQPLPLQFIPPPLERLQEGDTTESCHFLKNSRAYYDALQLTSTDTMKVAKGTPAPSKDKALSKKSEEINPKKRRAAAAKESKAQRKPKRATKDPNQPKRPPSAFFVFLEDFRKTYMDEHPATKAVSAVGKAAGGKWKSLSEEEKAPYVAKAEKRKADYEKAMQAYNHKESAAASSKSKAEAHNEDEEEAEEDVEEEEEEEDDDE